jgi:threonine aldolase
MSFAMRLSDGVVDARSDTVTKPTDAMRRAMADAEVGDDVLGDDRTVKALEHKMASTFGFQAAVFTPSGTMANLLAIACWCDERGSEAIIGDKSHVHLYEQGGMSSLMGVHSRTLKNREDGTLALEDIRAAIRTVSDDHFPVTKVVALENTQNKCGGKVLPVDYVREVGALCAEHGVKLHMDGARIWNAMATIGNVRAEDFLRGCDSASVCLSKAIGAPVGSVLLGDEAFVRKAKRLRKALGGSMRQVGVLAAAALEAIDEVFPKITEDHERAKAFAAALQGATGLECATPESNLVLVRSTIPGITSDILMRELEMSHGVLVFPTNQDTIRVAFHHQITDEGVERLITGFRESVLELARDPKLNEIMMSDAM